MKIFIFSFSKDKNSTKRPHPSTGVELSVELKQDTSIMFPVFRLEEDNYSTDFNYIYVPKWGKYYYIDNSTITMGGIWELACTEDVLSTWKNEIGADSYYILRSSAVYNTDIVDDYYPAYQNASTETVFGSYNFSNNLNNGYYVVGIVSRAAYTGSNGMGAVAYYVMDSAQMRELLETLMSTSDWTGVPSSVADGGIDHQLLKALYNPFQYIVSCKWFPFKPPVGGGIGGAIPYGWWRLPMDLPSGHTLNAENLYHLPTQEINFDMDVHQHPQAATRGHYLNGAPFRKLELIAGPFGTIPIDSSVINTTSKLGVTIRVDCITGEANLYLSVGRSSEGGADYGKLFPVHHANLGVNIQMAQIANDALMQYETVTTGNYAELRDVLRTGAAATDVMNMVNPMAGTMNAGAMGFETAITHTHAVADGVRSAVPSVQVSGPQGSIAAFDGPFKLIHTYYNIVDDDNDRVGRPYCAVGSPATIGNGFYIMKRGEVNCNANSIEKNVIAQYLESGIHYE